VAPEVIRLYENGSDDSMNTALSKKVWPITRLDLIVVLTIGLVLGILVAMFLPMLLRATRLARQGPGIQNLKAIGQAIYTYHDGNTVSFCTRRRSPSGKHILSVEGRTGNFDEKGGPQWLATVSIREDLQERYPRMKLSTFERTLVEDTMSFPTGFLMRVGWTESDSVLLDGEGFGKVIYEVRDGVCTKRRLE